MASRLAEEGATVDPSARPDGFDFAKADATYVDLLGGALAGSWSPAEIEDMARRREAGETVDGGLGVDGATLRHRGWLSANERRLQMRARWRQFFERFDVVLAPVSPTVAIGHDHTFPMSRRTIEVPAPPGPTPTRCGGWGCSASSTSR